MKTEINTTIILTKAEQKTIKALYNILDNDDNLDADGVWDILTEIISCKNSAQDYGYIIRIED